MSKKFLKKIIAQSAKDLQLVSACCSEGKVKLSEIKYLPKNGSLKINMICGLGEKHFILLTISLS